MWEYIICAVICAVIWIINGRCIIRSAREHITGEVYSHTGLGIFFTLLTVELILVFQSFFSIVLSTVAVVCFRMGATKEDEFNIKEFGDAYREYIKKVPMWNIFKGLRLKNKEQHNF